MMEGERGGGQCRCSLVDPMTMLLSRSSWSIVRSNLSRLLSLDLKDTVVD
jgi:hypothetical protein